MTPSRANPMGREWFEMDDAARLEYLKERLDPPPMPDQSPKAKADPWEKKPLSATKSGPTHVEMTAAKGEEIAGDVLREAMVQFLEFPSDDLWSDVWHLAANYRGAWMNRRKLL